MLGIGADESFVEDAAGKLVEVFFFDGAKHARADFGDVGNVIERDVFFLARFAEFVAELTHIVLPGGAFRQCDDGNIIGQAEGARHRQEANGEVTEGMSRGKIPTSRKDARHGAPLRDF
jgi:hypothetical protein